MFIPKNFKYKKSFKLKIKHFRNKNKFLMFGDYGLKSLTTNKLNSKQIEVLRRVLSKNVKTYKKSGKFAKFWIRVYPYTSVTKKPNAVRMGKGKGNVDHWECSLSKGQIFIEIFGFGSEKSKEILEICKHKIPFCTKIFFIKK